MPTIFQDKVVAGTVVFNDPLSLPLPSGVVQWGLDVFDGWDDTTEIESYFLSIGSVDGEEPGEFFPAKGRQLIIGGWAEAVDRATAHALWDILVRDAFPRNATIHLERHEPVPKFVDALVSAKRTIDWTGPRAFRWGIPARAPDPFKYALTAIDSGFIGVAGQSTGGRTYPRTYPLTYTTIASGEANSAIIVNSGTAESKRFTVTLTGPLNSGGWRLVNETSNESLKFNIGLGATDELVIDFHTELALLNGFPITATLSGDFWRLKTGPNVVKLYAEFDAAAGFQIEAHSAWE